MNQIPIPRKVLLTWLKCRVIRFVLNFNKNLFNKKGNYKFTTKQINTIYNKHKSCAKLTPCMVPFLTIHNQQDSQKKRKKYNQHKQSMETLYVWCEILLYAWTKNYVHVRYICHYQTEAKAKSVIFRVGGWSWTTTSPPVPVTLLLTTVWPPLLK